jgi:hypothetical protein
MKNKLIILAAAALTTGAAVCGEPTLKEEAAAIAEGICIQHALDYLNDHIKMTAVKKVYYENNEQVTEITHDIENKRGDLKVNATFSKRAKSELEKCIKETTLVVLEQPIFKNESK